MFFDIVVFAGGAAAMFTVPKLRHPLAANNVEERTHARRSRREPVAPTAEHLLLDDDG